MERQVYLFVQGIFVLYCLFFNVWKYVYVIIMGGGG